MIQPRTSLAFLIVALVISGYLFLNSDYFTAAALEWTGLVLLEEEQLNEYIGFQPTNVLYLDKGQLVRRLEEHPWVEKASVKWAWPNRIAVTVEERLPLAWVRRGSDVYVLDKNGALMTPPRQLPVLELPEVVNAAVDSSAQLKAAARVLTAVPPSIVGILAKWDAGTRSLVTKSGVEILIGDLESLEAKFVLLEELWKDLASQGAEPLVIDLRVPKSPVVRLKQR